MRALIIDDEAKAKVGKVLAYAEQNHYKPDEGAPIPGDDAHYVAILDSYRAVFTFTHGDGAIWRHLTISVPSKDYPHRAAAFMIASLFGFTGWDEKTIDRPPSDWLLDVNQDEHCVVLAQRQPQEQR